MSKLGKKLSKLEICEASLEGFEPMTRCLEGSWCEFSAERPELRSALVFKYVGNLLKQLLLVRISSLTCRVSLPWIMAY